MVLIVPEDFGRLKSNGTLFDGSTTATFIGLARLGKLMGVRGGTTWLLFDGDCRICTAAASWVRAIDLLGRLRTRPIQDSGELLAALPAADRLGAVHAIAPDGRLLTGPEALPAILAALSAGPGLERLLRSSLPAMSTFARTYAVLAEVRGRLTCGVAATASAVRTPR